MEKSDSYRKGSGSSKKWDGGSGGGPGGSGRGPYGVVIPLVDWIMSEGLTTVRYRPVDLAAAEIAFFNNSLL